MRRSALVVVLVSALGLTGAQAVGLPDTGQTLCDDGSNVLVPCSSTNTGDAAAYPRQDGRFGRDAKAAAGTLVKVGGGSAGFDYTKIANNGSDLTAGAALGSNPADWACTRDNITGLTWEVKTSDGGVRDWNWSYGWYSTDSATNGGNAGGTSGNACSSTLNSCDTEALAAAVNGAALCSYTDWRLPTTRELFTLVHFGAQSPSIDAAFFPNTRASFFWSASTYSHSAALAWIVDFYDGNSPGPYSKSYNNYFVRLVRGGHF